MPKLNEHYQDLKESYLFAEIAHRVAAYEAEHPDAKIIRLGIGDVTLPLGDLAIKGLHEGVDAMASAETFKGYGPEQGYSFLRDAISAYYARNGVSVDATDIFISDGAKSDTGNISELFDTDNVILIPDPVYPVYVDSNIMNGKNVTYLSGNAENNFLPMPDPSVHADIIYLCSPNNPTGAVYNKEQLKEWVDYALANEAVILFDSAYEAFISDPELPRSIYAIEGAKKCAIEFCSLSKTAGFTGTRCGYCVVPRELVFTASNGQEMSLHAMWNRRQSTKFNGTSYIIQRGAEAVYSAQGKAQVEETVAYYMNNAKTIREGFLKAGITAFGGVNSPYVWAKTPAGVGSWEFFDTLLKKANVVTTPGAGFGPSGEGYIRLTAFGDDAATKEAVERVVTLL